MMTIPGVRVEDEGFFVCSAFSVAGSIATKAYLEVTAMADEPPPIIKVCLKSNIANFLVNYFIFSPLSGWSSQPDSSNQHIGSPPLRSFR